MAVKNAALARSKRLSLANQPLTPSDHLALSLPPQISCELLRQVRGTMQDLWVIWYRARCTLTVARLCYSNDTVAAIKATSDRVEALWLELYSQRHQGVVVISEVLWADIAILLIVADQIQRAVPRQLQVPAYKSQRDYCIAAANQIDAHTKD